MPFNTNCPGCGSLGPCGCSGDQCNFVSSEDVKYVGPNLAGTGIQTAALAFGRNPPTTGLTESWNVTSWTELNDLATSRSAGGSFGTTSSMVAAGGYTTDITAATEEWNAPDLSIKTFTTS